MKLKQMDGCDQVAVHGDDLSLFQMESESGTLCAVLLDGLGNEWCLPFKHSG